MTQQKFQKTIWDYYKKNNRDLLWRKTKDSYKILVSEIMLQQTQVPRVEIKYKSFLKKFPTTKVLAQAKLANVLKEWQGLGYNRRALYLKRCAEQIEKEFKGKFPKDFKTLCSLPGIGPATAGDIMAFAWNIPIPVIETNIRSVYIHFFFEGRTDVHDKEITPLIEKSLQDKKIQKNPREWYWALFDYGAYLKKSRKFGNPSRQSVHHLKQTKFEGSYRQKRAAVLRAILESPKKSQTKKELEKKLAYKVEILSRILFDLETEGLIKKIKNSYTI